MIESEREIAGALRLSNIYHRPAGGTDDVIRIHEASKDLLELPATFQIGANETVGKPIEKAAVMHGEFSRLSPRHL
jgi:hypothetical protein